MDIIRKADFNIWPQYDGSDKKREIIKLYLPPCKHYRNNLFIIELKYKYMKQIMKIKPHSGQSALPIYRLYY
jgi:hypothetical protein